MTSSAQRGVTNKRVTHKRVTKKRVTHNRVTYKRVTTKRVTHKRVANEVTYAGWWTLGSLVYEMNSTSAVPQPFSPRILEFTC